MINTVNPKLDVITPKLDSLIGMVSNLDISQVHATDSKLPEGFRNSNILIHSEQLKRSAKAIIATATSITGTNSSTWSGSNHKLSKRASDGDSLDAARKERIEQWIPQPAIEEEDSLQTDMTPGTAITSPSATARSLEDRDTTDSESDEEIQFDVVKLFLERGQREYKRHRHAEAMKMFRTGIRRAASLSSNRKAGLGLEHIQLKIAYCYLYQKQLHEAEHTFKEIVTHNKEKTSTAQTLHACAGLAQTYLCWESFRDAERWCKKSMSGWKRLVGKQHSLYSRSLWLMEFIHETEGHVDSAGVFSDLVLEVKAETESDDINAPDFQPERIRTLVTEFRMKSAEMLLSSLGFDPNSSGFSPNDALLKLAGTKAGHSLRSGANMTRAVQYLLKRGANVNAKDTSHVTPPLLASRSRQADNFQPLCERGADAKQVTFLGNSALHAAAREGHLQIVKLLCEHGAKINAKSRPNSDQHSGRISMVGLRGFLKLLHIDTPSASSRFPRANTDLAHVVSGTTAIVGAAYRGHTSVVEYLLSRGANMEQSDNSRRHTVLLAAASQGHESTVRFVLNAGASVDASDKDDMTALHIVVQKGWHSLTELLLAKGASASIAASSGMKPLITAASRDDAKGAKLLLNAGADIEARDKNTRTALIYACKNRCNAAMQILLEHGASTKTPPDVMTPLYIATSQDNVSGVSLLLGAGANPEAKFRGDYTPLLLAAREGYSDIVKLLLAHKALTETRSLKSYTALLIAALRGDIDMVKILLDAGADSEARGQCGETAVIAISNDYYSHNEWARGNKSFVEMLRLLCERGVNLSAKDSAGRTALHWAEWGANRGSSDRQTQVQILKSYGAE